MPPRTVILAIVAFWLTTSTWLFYREVWPRIRPGQPPPFTIDLADEARQHTKIPWSVYRGDQKIGKARTWVDYDEDSDTFELHGEMEQIELFHSRLMAVTFTIQKANGMYRVSREGELGEIAVDLSGNLLLAGEPNEFKARVAGTVDNRRFTPTGFVVWPGGKHELKGEPVAVSAFGSVLNPLHPVNRLSGIRPGQHWRIPLVDPVKDVMAAIVPTKLPGQASGPSYLDAVVLDEPQNLVWNGLDVPCLVIEYKGERDLTARTWVRQADGLVLRQEARQGDLVILQRDP